MMKRIAAGVLGAALLTFSVPAQAAEGKALPDYSWSFDGIFGKFDRPALQRGYQIYREVCAGCHAMRLVAFRNLADLGYDTDQIKAFAAEATVIDGPDNEGEMFEREGKPSDRFPSPFPNDKAAAAANGGATPPDLSLMAKARAHGPSYVRALLSEGYEDPPAGFEILEGQNYNSFFPGNRIAMAAPLDDDAVEYQDGTPASLDQMAADVAHFLMWAAEPKMEQRKQMGIKVILFLIVLSGILYAVKRKVWTGLH